MQSEDMPRIQIALPEHFIFQVDIPVRVADLNYGGHVGYDAILTILQEARVIFYRSLGFRDEISFEGSLGQIIADAAVQYRSESVIGDILVIKIAISDITKYGFDLLYHVQNKVSGKEIARAKTGIVCFDYNERKAARVPDSVLAKISPLT